eukprot:766885-Hanusia_phi.AAC.2
MSPITLSLSPRHFTCRLFAEGSHNSTRIANRFPTPCSSLQPCNERVGADLVINSAAPPWNHAVQ